MEDQFEEIARDEQAKGIDLYTYATPNGRKASIMLEETGLPYEVHIVDIERGDQRSPEFRALNPNGKIPVIVDRENGRTVFESGAILFYLAEKSGRFNPPTPEARSETLQWLLFQVGHIGPMLGQLWYFKHSASEKIPLAITRYERETLRLFGVLDARAGIPRWRLRHRRHRDLAVDRLIPRAQLIPRCAPEPEALARTNRETSSGNSRHCGSEFD